MFNFEDKEKFRLIPITDSGACKKPLYYAYQKSSKSIIGIVIRLKDGVYTIVDNTDEALEVAKRYNWYAAKHGGAYRPKSHAKNAGTVYLYRELLGNPAFSVDHLNGDPLDNRSSNLREADELAQALNRGSARTIRGAYPVGSRWRAMIRLQSGLKTLGTYATPEEAGDAYDAASFKEYHGTPYWPFVRLNRPELYLDYLDTQCVSFWLCCEAP